MKGFLIACVALLTLGLFVGGPDYYDNEVVRELWESGHFFLFLIASVYLFSYSKLNRMDTIRRALVVFGILLLAAFLTEALQLLVGRHFTGKDVLNDMLGACAGLLLPRLRFKPHPARSVVFVLVIALLVFISQRHLFAAVVQEVRLRQAFPVLSDFATARQLDWWEGNSARLSLSDSNVRNGKFSMRVDLNPGKYPGITLNHLFRDWQDYAFIRCSIFLEAAHPLDCVLMIYDRQHPGRGHHYRDRFNGEKSLHPGWNDFLVPLHLIENAPAGRTMDLTTIVVFSLFTVDLDQPVTFYLDSLALVKE